MADGDDADFFWTLDNGTTHMWFLTWLLLYNILYLIIDSNIAYFKMDLPAIWKILIGTFVLSYVDLLIYMGPNDIIRSPHQHCGLVFNSAAFMFGVIAYYNHWLDEITSYNVWLIRVLALFLFGLQIFCAFGEEMFSDWKQWQALWYPIYGFSCPIFCLFMVQTFSIWFDFTNTFLSMVARSAYSAYIIQYMILLPVYYSYFGVMEAVSNVIMDFEDSDGYTVFTDLENEWFLYLGVVYTICLSVPICWFISWILLKIPGLNKIL